MTNGQLFTFWSIRLATVFYVASLLLYFAQGNQRAEKGYRLTWTIGCIFYLAHVWAAFQFFHGWSHLAAYQETARQTTMRFGIDWGGGLYLNYAFSVIWVADTAWQWKSFDTYRRRPSWGSRTIHWFLAFMFFNATVIFASGFSRWFGVAATVGLTLTSLVARKSRPRKQLDSWPWKWSRPNIEGESQDS
jgi:hypothetical protein